MLEDALNLPRRGDDWLPTLLVGGLLTVLGFLIIPAIVLQGYLVRVLQTGVNDEQTPPSFVEWGELFVDGLKLIVVNLVYSLVVVVPTVIAFVALVTITTVTTSATGSGPGQMPAPTPTGPGAGGVIVFLGILLVVFVGALVLAYLLPAAMANFAREGRLGAAFSFRTILSGAFTSEYAIAWLLAVLVAFVGGLVGSALSVVIVGIFLLFYVQVSTYYLFGRGFAAGLASKRAGADAGGAEGSPDW